MKAQTGRPLRESNRSVAEIQLSITEPIPWAVENVSRVGQLRQLFPAEQMLGSSNAIHAGRIAIETSKANWKEMGGGRRGGRGGGKKCYPMRQRGH